MNNQFDIPVVIFFFKRHDLAVQVIDQIAKVKPKKLYLFCDGGRNEKEWEIVKQCRAKVEERITWDCEIIKNYANKNRGVYESIGKGALWVFEREEKAIFLEDDNLPEVSFFRYCQEMLEYYKEDKRILWVCGTNYLEEYDPADHSSYVFTKQLLPCGWASWSSKFKLMYDGDLELLKEESTVSKLRYTYKNQALYHQQLYTILGTQDKLKNNKPVSWDHQMNFSIRMNSAYGISPKYNQITNIGADERSTHGGSSLNKVMTRRFCGIKSYELEFPLIHPKTVSIDPIFEDATEKIILLPFNKRIINKCVRVIKPILGFGKYDSVSLDSLKKKIRTQKRISTFL